MWTSSLFHQNATCLHHDIAENCSLGVKQQSLVYSLKNGNKYQWFYKDKHGQFQFRKNEEHKHGQFQFRKNEEEKNHSSLRVL